MRSAATYLVLCFSLLPALLALLRLPRPLRFLRQTTQTQPGSTQLTGTIHATEALVPIAGIAAVARSVSTEIYVKQGKYSHWTPTGTSAHVSPCVLRTESGDIELLLENCELFGERWIYQEDAYRQLAELIPDGATVCATGTLEEVLGGGAEGYRSVGKRYVLHTTMLTLGNRRDSALRLLLPSLALFAVSGMLVTVALLIERTLQQINVSA